MILILLVFFIVASWPFWAYALTDADIFHWIPLSLEIRNHFNFLSMNQVDQSHGPLFAWGSGVFSKFFPLSFYGMAFFNILMAVLGVGLVYYFSSLWWKNSKVALVSGMVLSTSLAWVYLARTPMYDLTAAVGYLAFAGFYTLYISEKKKRFLLIALLGLIVGCLTRFSIVLGLSGFFVILLHIIYRRSLGLLIRDGLLLVLVGTIVNVPWLLSQVSLHGSAFWDVFLSDNLLRFVREPGIGVQPRRDYYGFILYSIVGMLPHSFALIAVVFQPSFWRQVRQDKRVQMLLAASIPCLILFSVSGHVKLARYIAYLFPFFAMLLGQFVVTASIDAKKWTSSIRGWGWGVVVFVSLILLMLTIQFSKQAVEGSVMVLGLAIMLLVQLGVILWGGGQHVDGYVKKTMTWLFSLSMAYILFFSLLTWESFQVSFLTEIREPIQLMLNNSIKY